MIKVVHSWAAHGVRKIWVLAHPGHTYPRPSLAVDADFGLFDQKSCTLWAAHECAKKLKVVDKEVISRRNCGELHKGSPRSVEDNFRPSKPRVGCAGARFCPPEGIKNH